MSVSLRSLSDADILSRTRTLATRERACTLQLLMHLNEIEQRKLHLKQGYSSMFDYCTSGLGYSEPAAFRRLRTARCVARFPEVYRMLEGNEASLSTIARVSRVLTAGNKNALLSRIRRRSQREVDAIVAEYDPRAALRDVVRPVVVRVSTGVRGVEALASSPATALAGAASTSAVAIATVTNPPTAPREAAELDTAPRDHDACENSAYFRCEGDSHPTGFATERRVQFQFAASVEFREKIEKVNPLAWHRLPANPSLEQVFELALDCFIEKHDPCERRERRKERVDAKVRPSGAGVTVGSRYVAASVKDEVFARDNGQCKFVGVDGRRCASRSALQVDHIKPVMRGGASTLDNLRLLCAYHNRLEAERLMGPLGRRETRLRE